MCESGDDIIREQALRIQNKNEYGYPFGSVCELASLQEA